MAESNKRNVSPLYMLDPISLTLFLSFYSPIITSASILAVSFFHQNFKGIIFLGYLLGCCFFRYFIYMYTSTSESSVNPGSNAICNAIEFSKYGNATFSVFVFGFIAAYMLIPMFINNSINFVVLIGLFVYCCTDVFIKLSNNCIRSKSEVFINFLAGLVSSGLIVGCMYVGGSSKYLFFNETQSNKEVCSMASTQTFKCQVYKNGELIN